MIVLNKIDARPDLDEVVAELAELLKSEVMTISKSVAGLPQLSARLLALTDPDANL